VFGMVEKPVPAVAPSTLAVAGRYILSPSVFNTIRAQESGAGGEIQLTDGIAALIGTEKVYAYRYEGKRYDCGNKVGFMEATIELALVDLTLRDKMLEHIRGIVAATPALMKPLQNNGPIPKAIIKADYRRTSHKLLREPLQNPVL
jgi:UTP--glucose-1-phosphate uridylyltransferase